MRFRKGYLKRKMSMFKKSIAILTVCISTSLLVGCNAGMAPSGGSNEEVKAAFEKMPVDEQIKLVQSSSMPAEAKKAKIDEIYKKAGKTPPPDGAPTGLPPGVGTPSQGGR